ncbi:MAG: CHAT domain-containing protein [candidate division Zixibacteria bacterium]|nr:CHAT domain-containing protein [candidate division Zixibacteria bacterium]
MRYFYNYSVWLNVIFSIAIAIVPVSTVLSAETDAQLHFENLQTSINYLQEDKNFDSCLILLSNTDVDIEYSDYQRLILSNACALCFMGLQEHAQADSVLNLALAKDESISPGDSITAEIYTNKAMANFHLRHLDISRDYVMRSLAIRKLIHGPEHELVAFNYTNLGMVFGSLHEYDSALFYHQKALKVRTELFGENSSEAAVNMYRISTVYSTLGQYDTADSLLKVVLRIKQDKLGENHLSISQVLNTIGILHFRIGDLTGAEDYHTQALSIQKQHIPESDTLIASTLCNIANVYLYDHQYQLAEEKYNTALNICTKYYGENNISVAQILANLGSLYNYMTRYKDAEDIYNRTIAIMTELEGPQSLGVAMGKAGLASIYNEQYRLEEAEIPYLESLKIFKKVFGPEHQNVAVTLYNIGLLYKKQGRILKASRYYSASLDLTRKAFGKMHQDNAQTLSALASIYKDMGRFDESDSLNFEALDILKQTVSENHPRVALCYIGLANTAGERHDFDMALKYCDKALAIRENVYGRDSYSVHYTYTTMGNIYYLMKRYREAEDYYQAVYEFISNSDDSTHALFMNAADGLGINLYAQEKYREAIDFHLQSLNMRNKLYSPDHPESNNSLEELANAYCAISDYDSAFTCYERFFNSRQQFLQYVFSFSSENQKLLWLNYYPLYIKSLFSTALAQQTPEYRRLTAETILKCKSIVVDVMLSEKKSILGTNDHDILANIDLLQALRTEAANLYLADLSKGDQAHSKRFNELIAEIEQIEAVLSEKSQVFRADYITRNFRVKDVCAALGREEVLWEYIKYEPYNHSIPGNHNERIGPPRYLAIRLDAMGDISLYDLGEAQEIDSLIMLARDKIDISYAYLFSSNVAVYEQELSELTNVLYRRLVQPIREHFPNDSVLFISPDDMLCLLPFEILFDGTGRYFIEDHSVCYLGSGRELLHNKTSTTTDNIAYVFSDPNFNSSFLDAAEELPIAKNQAGADIWEDELTFLRSGSCLSSEYQQLKYSRQESDAIINAIENSTSIATREFVGSAANESNIKSIQKPPYILHISTHGYFCETDPETEALDIVNPLLRSGLIMSGANRIIKESKNGTGYDFNEDGILTALEVSQLNLMNTEIATLSACETGVGRVLGSGGVLGLCRSFRHAGVRSLITSLWKVPDKEAAELMQLFYTNWLGGESKRDALRTASLTLMDKAKQKYGVAHPVLWSGFILTGNPK